MLWFIIKSRQIYFQLYFQKVIWVGGGGGTATPTQLPGNSPRGGSVLHHQRWQELPSLSSLVTNLATTWCHHLTLVPYCRVTPALVALEYMLTHQLCSVSFPPTGCQTSLLIKRHTLRLWCPGNPHISISTRTPPPLATSDLPNYWEIL